MSAAASINAQTLTLASIPMVEQGAIAAQFNALLKAAVHDCEERSGIEKSREVTLKVKMLPLVTARGLLEQVHVEFEMSNKVPGYTSMPHPMLVRRGDRLIFQPLSPDDPRQDPLPNLKPGERLNKETGEVESD